MIPAAEQWISEYVFCLSAQVRNTERPAAKAMQMFKMIFEEKLLSNPLRTIINYILEDKYEDPIRRRR